MLKHRPDTTLAASKTVVRLRVPWVRIPLPPPALADAQAAGKDHLGQTELAVQAVQRVRPDMTASDALAAVNLVRHE